MLVSSPRVRASLRAIVGRIASNPADQDDVFQEMLIHLWRNERNNPGQTLSWYLQSCKYFGMDYLKRGKSVDSKRREGCTVASMDERTEENEMEPELADVHDFREQLFADDVLALLKGRLSAGQRALVDALASGASISEVSEALGCSHQYVSKERKKIATALEKVLV